MGTKKSRANQKKGAKKELEPPIWTIVQKIVIPPVYAVVQPPTYEPSSTHPQFALKRTLLLFLPPLLALIAAAITLAEKLF